jgi:hypothetical protein
MIALNRFVFEQVKNYGLEARVNACMQDRSKLDEGDITVEEARAELRESPAWLANEQREWKSSTKVHYKVQRIPQFIPFFGFGRLDGIPVFFNHFRKERQIFDLTVAGRQFRVLRDDVESSIIFSTKSELSKKLQSPKIKKM